MTMHESSVNKSSGSDPDMFDLISGNTLQNKLDKVGYDGAISSNKITRQVNDLPHTNSPFAVIYIKLSFGMTMK